IPALSSTEPRQVDLALLLLEEAVSKDRYGRIKNVIDKKITEEVMTSVKDQPKTSKQSVAKGTMPKQNIAAEYSAVRPEWKKNINNAVIDRTPPMSKKQFLDLINFTSHHVTDPNLRQILEISAKSINNGEFFLAYTGMD